MNSDDRIAEAQRAGVVSLLLEVQQECIQFRKLVREWLESNLWASPDYNGSISCDFCFANVPWSGMKNQHPATPDYDACQHKDDCLVARTRHALR